MTAVAAKRRGRRKYGATAFVIVLGVSITWWLMQIDPYDTPMPTSSPTSTRLVKTTETAAPRSAPLGGTAPAAGVTIDLSTVTDLSPTVLDFYGMAPDLTAATVSAAKPLPLVRCSDRSVGLPSPSIRLAEGTTWSVSVHEDSRSVIVVASRPCANSPPAGAWTTDPSLQKLADEDVLGVHWIEAHLVGFDNASMGSGTAFLRPVEKCASRDGAAVRASYAGRIAVRPGMYRLLAHLLYTRAEHVNELKEEAALQYADPSNPEGSNVASPAGEVCVVAKQGGLTPSLEGPGVRWLSLGQYRENDKRGTLSGYWLPVKGEAADPSQPYFTHDLLGRMNYGMSYGKPRKPGSQRCDRACFLTLLQHRTIYFVGDSHMRILFYGFLARLRIPFPQNKIWRGDRTDYVASHNVTIKFVASYFLNLSRPTALTALRDTSTPIIVAGVGQHHTCHCWSVSKHLTVMHAALRELLGLQPVSNDASTQQRRQLLWFGIPGQPVNRHLHIPKPVGQSRRDCRNNARHLIFNEVQRNLVQQYKSVLPHVDINFIDGFARSVGMTHTSLDGAHYYGWVRDAWIDDIAEALTKGSL